MSLKISQLLGSWKGKMLKPINLDVETILGVVLGTCMRCHKHKLIYKVPIENKILKQILRYITSYIYTICLVTL